MKKILSGILGVIVLISCSGSKKTEGLYADIKTTKGEISIQLDYKNAPITVANFILLAEGEHPFVESKFKGEKFYDGLTFHRVVKDFIIQGGCPYGTGTGGPGYNFKDEVENGLKHAKGTVSMANSGPGTNGSQFFITVADSSNVAHLNGRHTIFGKVISGYDVAVSIESGDEIEQVMIVAKGVEATSFNALEQFSSYFGPIKDKEDMAMKQTLEKYLPLKSKAKKLESGVMVYYEKKETRGRKPKAEHFIEINFATFTDQGKLLQTNIQKVDQTFFDENNGLVQAKIDNAFYKPIKMPYSETVPFPAGFKEVLFSLKIKEKVVAFIPRELAYREQELQMVPEGDMILYLEILSEGEAMPSPSAIPQVPRN